MRRPGELDVNLLVSIAGVASQDRGRIVVDTTKGRNLNASANVLQVAIKQRKHSRHGLQRLRNVMLVINRARLDLLLEGLVGTYRSILVEDQDRRLPGANDGAVNHRSVNAEAQPRDFLAHGSALERTCSGWPADRPELSHRMSSR